MPVAGLLEEVVEIPDGVQLRVDGDFVVVTGGGHTLRRRLSHPRLRIDVKGPQATVRCEYPRPTRSKPRGSADSTLESSRTESTSRRRPGRREDGGREGAEGGRQDREEGEEDRRSRGTRAGAGAPHGDGDSHREEGRTPRLVRTLRPESRRKGRRPPKAASHVHREGGGQEGRARRRETRASEGGKEAQRETEGESEAFEREEGQEGRGRGG